MLKEIDKKINRVYEIRFVKYDDGERLLDSAKDVRRNLNIYEWSKRTDDMKCNCSERNGKIDNEVYEKRSLGCKT